MLLKLTHTIAIITFIMVVACAESCVQKGTEKPIADSENSASYQPKEYVQLQHPAWSRSATIYQVNIRQYTPEGTFKAFESHLGRLKEMGVDILWIMPVHPIGIKGRKGTLGSPYAVKDYYAINPEFGNMDDFRHLVDTAHAVGMHILIDWVANHSARDNELVTTHPEWYIKNRDNQFISTPWRDYDDIIDFDYDQPKLRAYMENAMKFWIRETGIDGFRCDVASFVPIDFWAHCRAALDSIRPVFMLAEAADRDLHQKAFDMTYAWALWDALHNITSNKKPIDVLTGGYIAEHVSIWPTDAIRMNFIDNHDKNAWEGTSQVNFGKGLHAAIVLTGTMEGMPMMYSGQEAGLNRALPFFEKDSIQWRADTVGSLYSRLFNLKHNNQALWNGKWGGNMIRLNNDKMQQVISFVREKNNDKIISIVNMSDQPVSTIIETKLDTGNYQELFTGTAYTLGGSNSFTLPAWGYLVLVKQ